LAKFTPEQFETRLPGLITVFGINDQIILVALDREVIMEEVKDFSLGKELTSDKDPCGFWLQ
jgi:hypothetical protein